ncbi:transglutaminase-like domain-containing protein [Fontivita pretiosa]|uniref:transglutaminase-like domain-containing protein n=1 Tax=Fontivita pretiosa TaxID=2989684 RepID=UPI003D1839DB
MLREQDGPTGASRAWTSDDPAIARARQLVLRGELAQAEQLLAGASDVAPDQTAEMLDLIRRFRLEYNLTETQLLERLKGQIRDVTAGDLARWRDAGQLQHRLLDGQVMYFRREPANLFRFCPDAITRRTPQPQQDPGQWKLTDRLAYVIEQARRSGNVQVAPIRHRITYTLTVPGSARGAKRGSLLRVWLPFAQEYRQQKNVTLISTSPPDAKIAPNGWPHRTLYFEHVIDDPARPVELKAVFDYVSYAYYPNLRDQDARPLPADWDGQYLGERPPHIVFTPELRKTVAEIIGNETNPLAKARRIFHWIDANIRYCAEEEYCLIPSFTIKALSTRRGDCGIQSILFIAMCRAAGIPARWQSGWETKPVGWNMHDWAEFYVHPWGWLPADVSYGLQKSDDPAIREFYFGHQDSYRLITNLDYGRELVPAKPSLRSEPADFQRGEVELDGRNLYFDEWDYDFKFEQWAGQ